MSFSVFVPRRRRAGRILDMLWSWSISGSVVTNHRWGTMNAFFLLWNVFILWFFIWSHIDLFWQYFGANTFFSWTFFSRSLKSMTRDTRSKIWWSYTLRSITQTYNFPPPQSILAVCSTIQRLAKKSASLTAHHYQSPTDGLSRLTRNTGISMLINLHVRQHMNESSKVLFCFFSTLFNVFPFASFIDFSVNAKWGHFYSLQSTSSYCPRRDMLKEVEMPNSPLNKAGSGTNSFVSLRPDADEQSNAWSAVGVGKCCKGNKLVFPFHFHIVIVCPF